MKPKKQTKDRRRTTVYPEPSTMAIIGGGTADLNLALDVFADIIYKRLLEVSLTRGEWCYLADILNSTMVDRSWSASSLALEVADAARLDHTDEKWSVDAQKLASDIQTGGELLTWAILFVTRFFWEHHEAISLDKDEFWTPKFIRDYK